MLRIGLLIALVLVLLGMVLVTPFGVGRGEKDFVAYWSAARQLATGHNPYDWPALSKLQSEALSSGEQENEAGIPSWNPPWLLLLLTPFGALPFGAAARIWLLLNIGLIETAMVIAWRSLGESSDKRELVLALVAGVLFGESLLTINMGQITSLVLIGLMIGIRLLQDGHDFWAGAALLLATIKPHLTYFVFLLLLVWVIRHRRWQVFAGLIAAGLASMVVMWIIFPGWLSAYWSLVGNQPFWAYPTATLGGLVYTLWGIKLFHFAGILLAPLALWFVRLAEARGWPTAVNAALLVSIPLSPFGFGFDQIMLLPAIAQMIIWLWRKQLPVRLAWLIGSGLLVIYIALLWMRATLTISDCWYVWVPLALLGLYVFGWTQLWEKPGRTRVILTQ
jgi:hypothetical protein